MAEDTLLPFDLPAPRRKKVSPDFEGLGDFVGRRSGSGSRSGAPLPSGGDIGRRIGVWRNPGTMVETLSAMLRFHKFGIAYGYEDASLVPC